MTGEVPDECVYRRVAELEERVRVLEAALHAIARSAAQSSSPSTDADMRSVVQFVNNHFQADIDYAGQEPAEVRVHESKRHDAGLQVWP